jgi:hypothetical protein
MLTYFFFFFFHIFIFFTTNQRQNILTFSTFYITSIIFYYYFQIKKFTTIQNFFTFLYKFFLFYITSSLFTNSKTNNPLLCSVHVFAKQAQCLTFLSHRHDWLCTSQQRHNKTLLPNLSNSLGLLTLQGFVCITIISCLIRSRTMTATSSAPKQKIKRGNDADELA